MMQRERLRIETERYDALIELKDVIEGGPERRAARLRTHPHDPFPKPRAPRPDPGELSNASELRRLRYECAYMTKRCDELAEKVGQLLIEKGSARD